MLDQPEGVTTALLRRLNVEAPRLREQLAGELERQPKVYGGKLYLSPRLQKALDVAEAEAARLKDEFVSTEHLLIAILDDAVSGPARTLLQSAGVTRERLYQAMTEVRGSQRVTDQNPEGKYQALEKYGRDLTEVARKG